MKTIYKVADLNAAGLCSRETHLYCDQLGIDFYKFVQTGLSIEELRDIQKRFDHPEFNRFMSEVAEHGR